MNKGRRNELTQLKYKKRIRKDINGDILYVTREGEYKYNPTVQDVIDDRGKLFYKSTSTPCSCWMCAYLKYHRYEQKIEDRKLIQEGLDDYYNGE